MQNIPKYPSIHTKPPQTGLNADGLTLLRIKPNLVEGYTGNQSFLFLIGASLYPTRAGQGWFHFTHTPHIRKLGLREVVISPSWYWLAKEMEFEPRYDNSLASGFPGYHTASLIIFARRERFFSPWHFCLSHNIHSTQWGSDRILTKEINSNFQRACATPEICNC